MSDLVITEFMDQSAVDDLAARFDLLYAPDLVDQPGRLRAALQDARALIVRNRTQVRGALLERAPALQAVGRLGVGLDNIDLAACEQRGVTVYPATGANDVAVAEYVLATAMLLARNAYTETERVIAGDWPRQRCIGREIQGQCLGLIGCGNIARETAKRARALGMQVMAHDPYLSAEAPVWQEIGRAEHLPQLLAAADVISLHLPLNEGTRNLIDRQALAAMKPSVLLINSARGGIVDEAALIEAMQAGRVAGAALDVFADEPLNGSDGKKFAGIANMLLTPHIAGVTEQSNVRVSALIADRITRHLMGAK